MKKGKIIQEIIEPCVKQNGFLYQGEENGIWLFKKQAEYIEQRFYVQEHRFGKEITLRFETSAYNSPTVDAYDIIQTNKSDSSFITSDLKKHKIVTEDLQIQRWWAYKNEEDFRKIINEFADIIVKYGFEILDEMSKEDSIIPTEEMASILYKEHSSLHEIFVKKYLNSRNEMNLKEIECWFDTIVKLLQETKNKKYEEVKPMLLEIAAFLGDEMLENAGGIWEHTEGTRVTYISGLNCYIWRNIQILNLVVEMWKADEKQLLPGIYSIAYESILPLSEEKMEILAEKNKYLLSSKKVSRE